MEVDFSGNGAGNALAQNLNTPTWGFDYLNPTFPPSAKDQDKSETQDGRKQKKDKHRKKNKKNKVKQQDDVGAQPQAVSSADLIKIKLEPKSDDESTTVTGSAATQKANTKTKLKKETTTT